MPEKGYPCCDTAVLLSVCHWLAINAVSRDEPLKKYNDAVSSSVSLCTLSSIWMYCLLYSLLYFCTFLPSLFLPLVSCVGVKGVGLQSTHWMIPTLKMKAPCLCTKYPRSSFASGNVILPPFLSFSSFLDCIACLNCKHGQ
jgi:hypothetical protein